MKLQSSMCGKFGVWNLWCNVPSPNEKTKYFTTVRRANQEGFEAGETHYSQCFISSTIS